MVLRVGARGGEKKLSKIVADLVEVSFGRVAVFKFASALYQLVRNYQRMTWKAKEVEERVNESAITQWKARPRQRLVFLSRGIIEQDPSTKNRPHVDSGRVFTEIITEAMV